MGRKRTPERRLRRGIWQIDKVIFGQQVIEPTRTGDLEEAETYLAHRTEKIRQASVYGVRPRRLFKVNTGTREQEVCQLRWDWEIQVPELSTSVFLLPALVVKNKEDRLVVLNPIARSLVEDQRGVHPSRAFTYRGRPVGHMYNSAWKRARITAAKAHAQTHGEPTSWGFAKR